MTTNFYQLISRMAIPAILLGCGNRRQRQRHPFLANALGDCRLDVPRGCPCH